MPPELLALVCFFNNFSGGMIQGLVVGQYLVVATTRQSLRKHFLSLTRSGGHCRSFLRETLIDKQLHLNAAILSAPVACLIFSDRI